MGQFPDEKRILVICPHMPKSNQTAGDKRLYEIVSFLAKNYTVDLYAYSGKDAPEEIAYYKSIFEQSGVRIIDDVPMAFETALAKNQYHIGFFEYWHAGYRIDTFRIYQPWATVIVDTVDLQFLRHTSGLAFGSTDPATVEHDKQTEIEIYQRADIIIAITEDERNELINNNIKNKIYVIPLLVDASTRTEHKRLPELLFVGGFLHKPNVDGLFWFVDEIWPIVKQVVPDVKLTVIGSNPTPTVLQLASQPDIEVLGFVPHIGVFMERALVSIAPLRFGAGMKGKVTEAMAAALPVVTTTFGAQGLEAISGKHMMIADDTEMFAQHVVSLLCSPQLSDKIGKEAQRHVLNLCGKEVVFAKLKHMIDEESPKFVPSNSSMKSLYLLTKSKVISRLRENNIAKNIIDSMRKSRRKL